MLLETTNRVAKFYGVWMIVWIAVAFTGNALSAHSEYAISAHLILSFTGLPLALFSFYTPNGTVLGTTVAGVLGFVQWVFIAELNGRLEKWWNRRHKKFNSSLNPDRR